SRKAVMRFIFLTPLLVAHMQACAAKPAPAQSTTYQTPGLFHPADTKARIELDQAVVLALPARSTRRSSSVPPHHHRDVARCRRQVARGRPAGARMGHRSATPTLAAP